ncbi:hypothetical protein DD595_25400, partial [Enterobacter cloacae complex sp. 4DZ3-17B2]
YFENSKWRIQYRELMLAFPVNFDIQYVLTHFTTRRLEKGLQSAIFFCFYTFLFKIVFKIKTVTY